MAEKLTSNFRRKIAAGTAIVGIVVAGCGGEIASRVRQNSSKRSATPSEVNPTKRLSANKIACWVVNGWQFGQQPQESNATLRKVARQLGVSESAVSQGNEDVVLCQATLTEAQVQEHAPDVAVESLPIPGIHCIAENVMPTLDAQEKIPKGYEPADIYCVTSDQNAGPNALSS